MLEIFKILGSVAIEGTDKAEKDMDSIAGKADSLAGKIGSAVSSIGGAVEKAGNKLMPVTAGITAIGAASGKMAIEFEDAIAKVSTIADTSEVSMEQMQNAIMELSNETGIAATDIADNVYNAISAGQKTGDAVNFVSKATQLAKAGFTDSASALDLLTTIMNAYGLEASEVDKVSNNLITTQNLGKTTVAELSSAMGKAIPTAKSVGLNLDELCGAYAVMTSNGIATAETTTYMSSMLNELGKQGTTSADAFAKGTEHIKEGGLTMKEAMEMGWSLTDVLSVLDEEAYASGTSISNMFGSAEAGKAASVLMDNASKLNDAVEQMGDSGKATEEAFNKLDTTSYGMQKTINELKNTGIELGTTLITMIAPYIEIPSTKVHELSVWFNSLDDEEKKQIINIGAVAAAIPPLLIVVGKVVSGIGNMISLFSKLSAAMGGAEGAATGVGGAIGGLSATVLGVIAVIGLLVAAFVDLWNTNEEFRNRIIGTWNEIKNTFTDFANAVNEELKALGIDFNEFGIYVEAAWKTLCDFLAPLFVGTWNEISAYFKLATDLILSVLKVFVGVLTGDWSKALDGLSKITTSFWEFVMKMFTNNLNTINQLTGGKITEMYNTWKDKIEGIKSIVKNGLDTINGFFNNLKLKFPDIKVPHFSISGSFNLDPPSVPSIGIDWYAKAMNDPMIMNSPTAFGLNKNGQIMAGGEAGSEVVSGTDTLMNLISDAVAAKNERLEEILQSILSYMPQMANMQLVTDTGALVGALAPGMDKELGKRASRKGRNV